MKRNPKPPPSAKDTAPMPPTPAESIPAESDLTWVAGRYRRGYNPYYAVERASLPNGGEVMRDGGTGRLYPPYRITGFPGVERRTFSEGTFADAYAAALVGQAAAAPSKPLADLPADLAAGLKRAMKGAYPKSAKEAKLVLTHLGVGIVPFKEGRTLRGYDLALPEGAGLGFDYYSPRTRHRGGFDKAALWGQGYGGYGSDPEVEAARVAFLAWIQQGAAEALGGDVAEKRARTAQGVPTEARSADPNVRTCGACWRDIKATATKFQGGRDPAGVRDAASHRYLVDHGYTVKWGRTGSCAGVATLPWEESDEAARLEIAALLVVSARVADVWRKWTAFVDRYDAGDSKGLPLIKKRGDRTSPYGVKPAVYEEIILLPLGDTKYEWRDKAAFNVADAHRFLQDKLWSERFGSIPYMRAALREWKPQAPNVVPAKGPPWVQTFQPEDFAGNPLTGDDDPSGPEPEPEPEPVPTPAEAVQAVLSDPRFIADYLPGPLTAREINKGYCVEFADALAERLPGAEVQWTPENEALPGHHWIKYEGRYYDAEAPQGVAHWRTLPIFRALSVPVPAAVEGTPVQLRLAVTWRGAKPPELQPQWISNLRGKGPKRAFREMKMDVLMPYADAVQLFTPEGLTDLGGKVDARIAAEAAKLGWDQGYLLRATLSEIKADPNRQALFTRDYWFDKISDDFGLGGWKVGRSPGLGSPLYEILLRGHATAAVTTPTPPAPAPAAEEPTSMPATATPFDYPIDPTETSRTEAWFRALFNAYDGRLDQPFLGTAMKSQFPRLGKPNVLATFTRLRGANQIVKGEGDEWIWPDLLPAAKDDKLLADLGVPTGGEDDEDLAGMEAEAAEHPEPELPEPATSEPEPTVAAPTPALVVSGGSPEEPGTLGEWGEIIQSSDPTAAPVLPMPFTPPSGVTWVDPSLYGWTWLEGPHDTSLTLRPWGNAPDAFVVVESLAGEDVGQSYFTKNGARGSASGGKVAAYAHMEELARSLAAVTAEHVAGVNPATGRQPLPPEWTPQVSARPNRAEWQNTAGSEDVWVEPWTDNWIGMETGTPGSAFPDAWTVGHNPRYVTDSTTKWYFNENGQGVAPGSMMGHSNGDRSTKPRPGGAQAAADFLLKTWGIAWTPGAYPQPAPPTPVQPAPPTPVKPGRPTTQAELLRRMVVFLGDTADKMEDGTITAARMKGLERLLDGAWDALMKLPPAAPRKGNPRPRRQNPSPLQGEPWRLDARRRVEAAFKAKYGVDPLPQGDPRIGKYIDATVPVFHFPSGMYRAQYFDKPLSRALGKLSFHKDELPDKSFTITVVVRSPFPAFPPGRLIVLDGRVGHIETQPEIRHYTEYDKDGKGKTMVKHHNVYAVRWHDTGTTDFRVPPEALAGATLVPLADASDFVPGKVVQSFGRQQRIERVDKRRHGGYGDGADSPDPDDWTLYFVGGGSTLVGRDGPSKVPVEAPVALIPARDQIVRVTSGHHTGLVGVVKTANAGALTLRLRPDRHLRPTLSRVEVTLAAPSNGDWWTVVSPLTATAHPQEGAEVLSWTSVYENGEWFIGTVVDNDAEGADDDEAYRDAHLIVEPADGGRGWLVQRVYPITRAEYDTTLAYIDQHG